MIHVDLEQQNLDYMGTRWKHNQGSRNEIYEDGMLHWFRL